MSSRGSAVLDTVRQAGESFKLKMLLRRPAVGVGLEKGSDAMALVSMGCDLGQGFLFGQPMPEQRFIALLQQRVTVRATAVDPAAESGAEPALQPA